MERTGILRQGSFKPHKLQSSAVETASVMQSIADSLLESGQPEAAASVALSALDMSLDEPLSVGTEAHFQAVSIIRKGIELAASADSLEDMTEEAELASLAHADAARAETASIFSLLRKQA